MSEHINSFCEMCFVSSNKSGYIMMFIAIRIMQRTGRLLEGRLTFLGLVLSLVYFGK